MIYITGDLHGQFERIYRFCSTMETERSDIIIVLGDAGINFARGLLDVQKKKGLSSLPITLFCIHGNHEQRPNTLPHYHEIPWHEGKVYVEDEYPNILFAKDGEIFDFDGVKTIVIGGAYSIDVAFRIPGIHWWPDEQPSDEIKLFVEEQLSSVGWTIDAVLTHTTPLQYEPIEKFLPGVDQSGVDKSTEKWLGSIEKKLKYRAWYCGHYHINKNINKLHFLFESIEEFYPPKLRNA